MAKLKFLLLILALQCSSILTCCSSEEEYSYEDDSKDESICSEGESLLSSNDMKEKIEDISTRLHIKDNIVISFYEKANNINTKYLNELDSMNMTASGPLNLKHILEAMEHISLQLEQFANQIAGRASEIAANREKFTDIIHRSEKMLDELQFFRILCERYCEDNYGRKLYHDELFPYNHDGYLRTMKYRSNKHCWVIRELNNEISDQLNHFQNQYMEEIIYLIDDKDHEYANKVFSFKKQLKEDALKYFAPTMYDILVLQDEYYYLAKKLSIANVSLDSAEIKIKTLTIEKKLIGLESNIKKYGLLCVDCLTRRREKRDLRRLQDIQGCDCKVEKSLYDLIDDEIEEIKKYIHDNMTDIFSDLEARLNGPVDMESLYEPGLKDDIQLKISYAQHTLDSRKREVGQFGIDEMMIYMQKLETVLVNLTIAEDFLSDALGL